MDMPGASVTFVCEVLKAIERKDGNISVTQSELDEIINLVGKIENIIDGE